MQIGLGISPSAAPDADPLADALAAEAAGYDFVSVSDHPAGSTATYETLTLLTWIAARTTRIGIASRVLGVPFRRPAMVAKAAESLQRLSGGRFVLGLGGGYADGEIAALTGAPLTPGEKIAGLADALHIIRAAWAGAVTYAGALHSVTGLELTPRPAQPIPIWLGTYGPRALALTGRMADGWIPSLGFAPPQQVPELLDRIRTASVAAGRPPDAVRAVYNVPVDLRSDTAADGVVTGSPQEVAEQLAAFAELGFTGVNVMPASAQERRLADEMLPALRSLTG